MEIRLKVLLIGGYGIFGGRLARSLLKYSPHHLVICGRSECKAKKFQSELKEIGYQEVDIEILDVCSDQLTSTLSRINPDIVVNAAGPYLLHTEPGNNFKIAHACIYHGCHYIDLADNRAFVSEFARLDELAKSRNVMLVSGASTVPGLSSAVIDEFSKQFSKLTQVHYGISPGNQLERGVATVSSILSYVGKPFPTLVNKREKTVFGWQELSRYDFGHSLGKRWMSNCDIPDLEIFPNRYPHLETIKFQAGLEISMLHLGLWLLSGLSRIGVIGNLAKYASLLTKMSDWFIKLGSDNGGMFVSLHGLGKNSEQKQLDWLLIAERGSGPNIPTIAAELVIKRIASGRAKAGAMPCVGLFRLHDFMRIAQRWGIYQKRIEK